MACILRDPPSSEELRNEVVPEESMPAQWTAEGAHTGDVETSWLATFGDAQLDALVAEAIQRNGDLRAAAARVEQAAAYVKVAGGELYPTVDALGRAGGEMGGDSSGLEGVIVTASWELDVWGRVRYGKRAGKEQYASAQSDFNFARQSLAALVAKSWFMVKLRFALAGSLLLSGMLLAAVTQAEESFSASGTTCRDITWKPEVLAKYPNVAAACQGVVQQGGETYAKFVGTVVQNSPAGLRMPFCSSATTLAERPTP